MVSIFTAFVFTSIVGTLLSLLLIAIRPITKRTFSPNWHYYTWLIVLLVMVLPVRFDVPLTESYKPEVISNAYLQSSSNEEHLTTIVEGDSPAAETSIVLSFGKALVMLWEEQSNTFAYIWLFVATGILVVRLGCYLHFIYNVKKHSKPMTLPLLSQYTKRKIRVRTSNSIVSPLLVGLFRPTLLLPATPMSLEQLQNILIHETTHLHRHDLAYKWFVCLVKCLHWFNPAVYLISNQIDVDCEITCDLAAVKDMNAEEEQGYMETILSLLTSKTSSIAPLSTGMTGNGKILKKRFTMIKNRKKISKKTYIASVIVATTILGVSLFASGAFAGSFLENVENENISTAIGSQNTSSAENKVEAKPSVNNEDSSHENTDSSVSIDKGTSNSVQNDTTPALIPVSGSGPELDVSIDALQTLTNTSFIWPTESRRISNPFGTRVHPITNETFTHNGVDIIAEEGSNVYASIVGTVVEADFDKGDGNYVIIENIDGIRTQYSHLSSIGVTVGEIVKQGNIVGKVGQTGSATGPHLHFSIKADGRYYDPMQLANSLY